MGLGGDRRNTLNFRAMRSVPLEPLDVGLLGRIVRPDYVRRVNRTVGWRGIPWEWYWRLSWQRGFRRAYWALHGRGVHDRRLPAYNAYLTLWPLQQLLRRIDAARAAPPD